MNDTKTVDFLDTDDGFITVEEALAPCTPAVRAAVLSVFAELRSMRESLDLIGDLLDERC